MSNDKPVRIPSERYPDVTYQRVPSLESFSQEPQDEAEIHLLDYWRIIVARRWTIYAIATTVVLVTMIATFKQTPIYQATTSIQIDRENPNILSFKDVYALESQTDDTLQTQYKVLSSRTLARRVIETLKLTEMQEFAPKEPGLLALYQKKLEDLIASGRNENGQEPDNLRRAIDAYLKRLEVSPVRQARLVNVSFESKNPLLAATIVNTHAAQFKEQNLQYKFDATQDASGFLQERLVGLQSKLENAEDRLQEYSQRNKILFTEEGKDTSTDNLKQLEQEFIRAQTERFQKESMDNIAQSGDTDALPQLTNNQLFSNLTTRLAELRRDESQLAVTFGPEYPSRKRIRGQIEEIDRTLKDEKARVVQGIQAEYKTALQREKLLSKALEDQKDEVNRIKQEIIQYNILKREVDSLRALYDGLLMRLKEAEISAGLKASNVRVVDRAETPNIPVSPRKSINLLLSLLGGLALGIAVAFFQEYMDSSIKSSDDITRHLKIATLGMIPKLQSLTGSRKYGYAYGHSQTLEKLPEGNKGIELITHASPHSLMAEAYRSVRTSLLLSAADHPPHSFIVTSALPSEGKTVTAVNMAISLTQTGSKVILIDGDMRKPRLHNVFGLNGGPGLSGFLSGSATLKDVIYPTEVPNLFVLPCGLLPPNPAELILSDRLRQMVHVLRNYFDFVILDSPPLLNVSDARILSLACEASMLVIKASATSRYVAKRAIDDLAASSGRVLGTVLNDVDVRVSSSGYQSYYTSKYSYGGYGSYGAYGNQRGDRKSQNS